MLKPRHSTLNACLIPVAVLAACFWAACGQSVNQGQGDGGTTIKVQYGTSSQTVDLTKITPSTIEGNTGAKITDVITKAFPQATLSTIAADFIGSDGFRPSAKNSCRKLIPIKGDTLASGVLDPTSATLEWAPSLGYGGCMSVKGVAEILVVNQSDTGPTFTVKAGDTSVDVDLRFQPTTDVSGEQRIMLQGLITSSGASDSPQNFNYDFAAPDGTSPGANQGATLLTWDQLASGSLQPQTRNLAFDASSGIPAVWNLTEAAAAVLYQTVIVPKKVTVYHGTDEIVIDLGTLQTVTVGADQLVVLQTVVQAAALVADPSIQHFDIEDPTGWSPVTKKSATPLTWDQLALGYINPGSANVSFDASLGLKNYWNVTNAAKIHLMD